MCININIHVYINANQFIKNGFNVKCGISRLAFRGTQTKAISPSASYEGFKSLIKNGNLIVIAGTALYLTLNRKPYYFQPRSDVTLMLFSKSTDSVCSNYEGEENERLKNSSKLIKNIPLKIYNAKL